VLVALTVIGATVLGRLPEALVAVVGISLAVWIAVRPQRGILLAVALVPLDGLRLPLGIDGTVASWKEGLALFTAACAVISAQKVARRTRPDWFWWLVALVGVAAISFGIHQSKAALWGMKLDFIYLTLTYAAWRCPLNAKDRDRFVSIIMGIGTLAAGYGVVQQLLGHERLHELGYEYNSVLRFNGGFLRSISTFALPFSFGFFMIMVIVIGLPVALSDLTRWRNRLFLVVTPLLVVGLVTSIVRTAMLGLLVGLLYLGIRRYRSIIAVLVPLGLVALFFIPGSSATSALSSDSTKARSANWTENIDAITGRPFGLGVGETGAAKARAYGQTVEEQAAAFNIDLNQPDSDVYTPVLGANGVYQPDNYYVKTVIELGVLGLWFLIRVLYGAVRESRALERVPDRTDAALGVGITAFLLAAIFSMFFATYLELFPMDAYFWLLLGVTAATVREYRATPDSPATAAPAAAAGGAR
jgi:O-Antigen ligase